MRLDRARAIAAVQRIAAIRLSCRSWRPQVASPKIAEFKMADIIRKMTVEKGIRSERFRPVRLRRRRPGARGRVRARTRRAESGHPAERDRVDLVCLRRGFRRHAARLRTVDIQPSPFDAQRVNDVLDALERKANEQMDRDGIAQPRRRFNCSLDMRHEGQINEVEVVSGAAPRADSRSLKQRFYTRYEQLTDGVRRSAARASRSSLPRARHGRDAGPSSWRRAPGRRHSGAAQRTERAVYWDELRGLEPTPVFDGEILLPGNHISGPAVIETPDTSVSCTRARPSASRVR